MSVLFLSSEIWAFSSSPLSLKSKTYHHNQHYKYPCRHNISHRPYRKTTFPLVLSSKNDDIDVDQDNANVVPMIRRLDPVGVSVSECGFVALFSVLMDDGSAILPIRITSDPMDAHAANSVEALTYIQLLGYGIDMGSAGVFPPRLLDDLAALHCTNNNDAEADEGCAIIRESLDNYLPDDVTFYDANPWLRSRVKFPKVELNAIRLDLPNFAPKESEGESVPMLIPFDFTLECLVDGKRLGIYLSTELVDDSADSSGCEPLQATSYQYGPASAAFTSLSLALRYKTPISMSNDVLLRIQNSYPFSYLRYEEGAMSEAIGAVFPRWRSTTDLKGQTERVEKNLMQSFEANKLEGALRIAIEKGDDAAAQKIRERLDKFDSFEDLPTIEEEGASVNFEKGEEGFQ